jgi:predicted ferric reductase
VRGLKKNGTNVVMRKYGRRAILRSLPILGTTVMGSLLYIIAVILVIAWAVGFVGYNAGALIHALLVIAIIAVLFRVISGRRAL